MKLILFHESRLGSLMLMFGQNLMFDDFENIQTLVMFCGVGLCVSQGHFVLQFGCLLLSLPSVGHITYVCLSLQLKHLHTLILRTPLFPSGLAGS